MEEIMRAEANARFEAGQELIANQARRDVSIDETNNNDDTRLRNSLAVLKAEQDVANSQRTLELDCLEEMLKQQLKQEFKNYLLKRFYRNSNNSKRKRTKRVITIIEKRYELLNAEIKANNQFLEKQGELINGLVKANAAITGVDVLPSDLVQTGAGS